MKFALPVVCLALSIPSAVVAAAASSGRLQGGGSTGSIRAEKATAAEAAVAKAVRSLEVKPGAHAAATSRGLRSAVGSASTEAAFFHDVVSKTRQEQQQGRALAGTCDLEQTLTKLYPTNINSAYSSFDLGLGQDIAIDGDWMVMGVYSRYQAIYVYKWDGSQWIEHQTIEYPALDQDAGYGQHVDISGDTIVAEAWKDNGNGDGAGGFGSVFVYRLDAADNDKWKQEAVIANEVGAFTWYGEFLRVDGDTLVIPARNEKAAYVYDRDCSSGTCSWSLNKKFTGETSSEFFGWYSALSGNSLFFPAIGVGIDGKSNTGQVNYYTRTEAGGQWTLQQSFTPPSIVAEDRFGQIMAFDGTTLFVPVLRQFDGAWAVGYAYIYEQNSNTGEWEVTQEFGDPSGAAGILYGAWRPSVRGDTLAIPSRAGIDVWKKVDGSWAQQKVIAKSGEMCQATAFHDDSLVFGCRAADGNKGAVYYLTCPDAFPAAAADGGDGSASAGGVATGPTQPGEWWDSSAWDITPYLTTKCDAGFVTCCNGFEGECDAEGKETSSKTCMDACADGAGGYDCCRNDSGTGDVNACLKFTGKVCRDGSCSGETACFQANAGEVINGCQGKRSCYEVGHDHHSTTRKPVPRIHNSCRSPNNACSFMAYNLGEIGNVINSCNGSPDPEALDDHQCNNLSYGTSKVGDVVNSCNGQKACSRAVENNTGYGSAKPATLGNIIRSCNRADGESGYGPCYMTVTNGATLGDIVDSCNWTSGCTQMFHTHENKGLQSKGGNVVRSGNGKEGMFYVGLSGGVTGDFYDSCNEQGACSHMAYGAGNAEGTATVGNVIGSCNANNACHRVTMYGGSFGDILGSCLTANSCEFLAMNNDPDNQDKSLTCCENESEATAGTCDASSPVDTTLCGIGDANTLESYCGSGSCPVGADRPASPSTGADGATASASISNYVPYPQPDTCVEGTDYRVFTVTSSSSDAFIEGSLPYYIFLAGTPSTDGGIALTSGCKHVIKFNIPESELDANGVAEINLFPSGSASQNWVHNDADLGTNINLSTVLQDYIYGTPSLPGVHLISSMVLDGTSQPGYEYLSPKVVLRGKKDAGEYWLAPFDYQNDRRTVSVIRGFSLVGWSGIMSWVHCSAIIQANVFGLLPDGTAEEMHGYGVHLHNTLADRFTIIGSDEDGINDDKEGNVFANTKHNAIWYDNGDNTKVVGNTFGVNPDLTKSALADSMILNRYIRGGWGSQNNDFRGNLFYGTFPVINLSGPQMLWTEADNTANYLMTDTDGPDPCFGACVGGCFDDGTTCTSDGTTATCSSQRAADAICLAGTTEAGDFAQGQCTAEGSCVATGEVLVDQCEGDNNGCSQTCNSPVGTCSCNADFFLESDGKTCSPTDKCLVDQNGCSQVCNSPDGTCSCNDGYSLTSDGKNCVDIDECSTDADNCDANASCENTVGGFTCTCNPGYTGTGTSCTDIDECTEGTHSCDANASCQNAPAGSHSCTCNAGYEGDGNTCTNIDECATKNGGCAHICTDTDGSFECSCRAGYALDDDNAGCSTIYIGAEQSLPAAEAAAAEAADTVTAFFTARSAHEVANHNLDAATTQLEDATTAHAEAQAKATALTKEYDQAVAYEATMKKAFDDATARANADDATAAERHRLPIEAEIAYNEATAVRVEAETAKEAAESEEQAAADDLADATATKDQATAAEAAAKTSLDTELAEVSANLLIPKINPTTLDFPYVDTDGDLIPNDFDACPTQMGLRRNTDRRTSSENPGPQDFCPSGCPETGADGTTVLDSDGDGIPDCEDRCPFEAGIKYNHLWTWDKFNADEIDTLDANMAYHGCPDRDGDGIPDKFDACPTQAGGKCYSGCPDKGIDPVTQKAYDGDMDGVSDCDDRCPGFYGPGNSGGCPDGDFDGTPDYRDYCPSNPGDALFAYERKLESNDQKYMNILGCPDTDKDLVPDQADICDAPAYPNQDAATFTGLTRVAVVNNKGCPLDSDQDGVYDGIDNCDGTVHSDNDYHDHRAIVFSPTDDGFSAANDETKLGCPKDTDNDGVADGIDQCPTEGGYIGRDGCPIDSDNDGVKDCVSTQAPTSYTWPFEPTACHSTEAMPDAACCTVEQDMCADTVRGATVYADEYTHPKLDDSVDPGCSFDTDKDGVVDGVDLCPYTTDVEIALSKSNPNKVSIDDKGCATMSAAMWDSTFVDVTTGSEGANPKVELLFTVDALLPRIATSRKYDVANELVAVQVMDASCTNTFDDETDAGNPKLLPATVAVNKKGLFTGQTPTDSIPITIDVNLSPDNVVGSEVWTTAPPFDVGSIDFCLGFAVLSDTKKSVTYKELKTTILIDMTQDFAVTDISVERNEAEETTKLIDIEYPLAACQCTTDNTCVEDSDLDDSFLSQSDSLKLCVRFAPDTDNNDELPPDYVRMTDVKSFTCNQGGLSISPIVNFERQGDGGQLTSVETINNALGDGQSYTKDGRMLIVNTRLPATFFGAEERPVDCVGTIVYEFAAGSVIDPSLVGTGRQRLLSEASVPLTSGQTSRRDAEEAPEAEAESEFSIEVMLAKAAGGRSLGVIVGAAVASALVVVSGAAVTTMAIRRGGSSGVPKISNRQGSAAQEAWAETAASTQEEGRAFTIANGAVA